MTRTAKIGSRAPAFAMEATDGAGVECRRAQLDDYLGHWLVLLFYPRDFSLI